MDSDLLLLNLNQPWSSDDELMNWFNITYESSYSDCDDKQITDLSWSRDVVLKWRARSRSVELETVSLLISAEIEYLRSKSMESESLNLPSLFSLGIIRFCQVLRYYAVDEAGEITRSAHLRNLTTKIAESLCVPSWIVDLRHEACHSKNPSLTLLRQAAFIIQDWLKINFWLPKIRKSEDFDFGRVAQLLRSFMNKPTDEKKSLISSALKEEHHKVLRVVVHVITSSIEVPVSDVEADFTSLKVSPEVKKRINIVIHLIFKKHLIHEILHLLINVFNFEDGGINIPAVICFKEIVCSILRSKDNNNSRMGRSLQEFLVSLKSNLCLQVIFLRIAHHLTEEPMMFTPALLEMFALLFSGTKYHELVKKLASFSSLLVGCNGLINGYVKKMDIEVKDIDSLKRAISSDTQSKSKAQNKKIKFYD